MWVNNKKIISSGNMNATISSLAEQLENCYSFAVQAVVSTGTSPTGTLGVQASCDPITDRSSDTVVANWTPLTALDIAITDNGVYLINIENAGYNWVRFVYTFTSGTGTLNARINRKGF